MAWNRERDERRRIGATSTLGCLLAAALPLVCLACVDSTAPAEPDSVDLGGPAAAVPPVRRLTNSEYIASVRALFDPLDLELTTAALPSAVDVDGFDNHIDLSAAYPSVVESYRLLAIEVSSRVWRDLEPASGCQSNQRECIREWIGELGDRIAWKSDARSILTSTFDAWTDVLGLEEATRSTIQLLLLSPEFTYAPRSGNHSNGAWVALEGRPLARRLAFLLWAGPPDAILLAAADQGELATVEGVRAQALRMLEDERARAGVLHFYEQLLEWERAAETTLDPESYLLESPHIANDQIEARTEEFVGEYLRFRLQPAMRAESELFVTHHLFAGEGTLAALLTGIESFATWDLAELVYGIDVDQSQPPVHVVYGPVEGLEYPMYPIEHIAEERAGLLTLAAFLHGHAGPIQPSPVRRGAFVMARLLCQPPAAPPDDVPPLPATASAESITNRERFAEHTENPNCQGCHLAMDSIGFTFEGYDSLGAVRLFDAGQPVDTSGALFGTDKNGPLVDAVELAQVLAGSRTVHDCHVRNWFRYAFGRTETTTDHELLQALQQDFWDAGGDIQALILAIVSSEEFRHWRADS
jgi:hypothetical protein